jgi:hypothetical protein
VTTCDRCFQGRHIRCTLKGRCSCTICGTGASTALIQRVTEPKTPKPQRKPRVSGARRAPVFAPALPAPMVRAIKDALRDGVGVAEIVHSSGATRGQVDRIRKNMNRTSEVAA